MLGWKMNPAHSGDMIHYRGMTMVRLRISVNGKLHGD